MDTSNIIDCWGVAQTGKSVRFVRAGARSGGQGELRDKTCKTRKFKLHIKPQQNTVSQFVSAIVFQTH